MALLHHMYSIPFARVSIRSHAFALTLSSRSSLFYTTVTTATNYTATSTTATTKSAPSHVSPARVPLPDSRVLLGMSEQELQQLALYFGQLSYKGKQLHPLIYKRKLKEIEEFAQLPRALRNELQKAGGKVGSLAGASYGHYY